MTRKTDLRFPQELFYLDYKKVFYQINYLILVVKIGKFGLRGRLLKSLGEFLNVKTLLLGAILVTTRISISAIAA